jgi:hypothetical protein
MYREDLGVMANGRQINFVCDAHWQRYTKVIRWKVDPVKVSTDYLEIL